MGPVPEQVLPGTSTGPQPFALDGAGISGGGTPRPPGQEDPDPSPQHVQGPGGLRPGQPGRVLKNLLFWSAGLGPGPPAPPWAPLGPPGPLDPPWAPLGPPGVCWAPPGFSEALGPWAPPLRFCRPSVCLPAPVPLWALP